MLFKEVGIVGVGLIGGSLGLELKKRKLCSKICGVSFHKESVLRAKKCGAIDEGSLDYRILKNSDLLIFAAPVDAILKLAPKISRIIKKDCIVTDVASTKETITSRLSKIFPNYCGSHPLAGSEKRGVMNAKTGLFKNSVVIVTPVKNTRDKAIKIIKRLWQEAGAKVRILTPSEHDKAISFTSHLPHITAFALIDSVPEKFFSYAATGLKDTTRIAASDEELWSSIFLSNRKNLAQSIRLFKASVSILEKAIKSGDKQKLSDCLKKSKNKREKLA